MQFQSSSKYAFYRNSHTDSKNLHVNTKYLEEPKTFQKVGSREVTRLISRITKLPAARTVLHWHSGIHNRSEGQKTSHMSV